MAGWIDFLKQHKCSSFLFHFTGWVLCIYTRHQNLFKLTPSCSCIAVYKHNLFLIFMFKCLPFINSQFHVVDCNYLFLSYH